MDNTKEKSNKKLFITSIISILVVAVLVVGGIVVYNNFFAEKPTSSDGVVRKITNGWETDIKEENFKQQKGVQVPGYSTAEMNSDDKSLHVSIGNPKDNECGFYATPKLDDGTVLYKSTRLRTDGSSAVENSCNGNI